MYASTQGNAAHDNDTVAVQTLTYIHNSAEHAVDICSKIDMSPPNVAIYRYIIAKLQCIYKASCTYVAIEELIRPPSSVRLVTTKLA